MKRSFASLAQVHDHGADTVIDVRSPSEFAEDHWPGAVNLPVLDDAERARVGTIYKQDSPFSARVSGAALVSRNAAAHLQGPLADKPGGWQPLVYCWRGGQRSGAFATILQQVGWRVGLVEGGYRSYRRLVVEYLHDRPMAHRLIVLDGNTGTAKTELLGLLEGRGVQVLDLEDLAAHRGSLFGAVAHAQPSQKAFESALAERLVGFDTSRPVAVEAESSRIGDVLLPPGLWKVMKAAPRIAISAPVAARADYLARTYRDAVSDRSRLGAVLTALVPFQGRELVERWQKLADAGAMTDLAAELVSRHYDPGYARARRARPEPAARLNVERLEADDLERLADGLLAVMAEL